MTLLREFLHDTRYAIRAVRRPPAPPSSSSQVSTALLLTGAGLLINTLVRLTNVDTGLRSRAARAEGGPTGRDATGLAGPQLIQPFQVGRIPARPP